MPFRNHHCLLRSVYLCAGTLGIGAVLPINVSYGQASILNQPLVEVPLEEVTVTAERRASTLQKTAAAVSVREGENLRKEGKFLLKNILEDVPGISSAGAEFGGSALTAGTDTQGSAVDIRGVRSNQGGGGTIVSTSPSTAVYVDGVYEGVGGRYDIETVEVLKGPQGTLYGRSATAGVIAIQTRSPVLNEFGADLWAEGGNYNLQHYGAALNIPVVDDVFAIRVAGNQYEQDGFLSDDGLGARENTDARVKMLYKPTESLSILVGAALQDNETETGGLLVSTSATDPDTYIYTNNPVNTGINNFRQYWSEINLNLGGPTLTYLPAFRAWEQNATIFAQGAQSIVQTQLTPKDDFMTHELRLSSNPDSPLIWQVGALYYKNELASQNTVRFASSGALGFAANVNKDAEATGAFAQATYPFTDSLRLTAGVRYDHTKVVTAQTYTANTNIPGADPNNFGLPEMLSTVVVTADQGTRNFDDVTYKLRLEQDLTQKNLLYVGVSTGVSPGEVTATTCTPMGTPCALALDAKTLTSFEVGSKNRFLADSLELNAAVFYYRYGGFQTAGVDVSNGANQFATLSSKAEFLGGELELTYQFTPADRVSLNVGYTDAKYVDQPTTPFDFQTFIAKDEIFSVVPLTANAAYSHEWRLPGNSTLSMRLQGRYLSEHDEGRITAAQLAQGFENLVRVDGEFIGDVSGTFSFAENRYSLTAYVRNVADNDYRTQTIISVDPISGNVTGSTLTPYDARTYGVVLTATF